MPESDSAKRQALAQVRTLHPAPDRVHAALFLQHPAFFDARDELQVKYEMLRAHFLDGPAGDNRLRGVRLQSSDLLPVARPVGAPRACRPARCTSRSGRPPHLHASGGRLSPCSARRRADIVDSSLAGPPRAHARGPSASADRGAGPGRRSTKKKRRGVVNQVVNPPPMRTGASTRGGSTWLEVRPKPNTSGGEPLSSAGTTAQERRARPGSASRAWPGSSRARQPSGRCTVWPRAHRAGPGRWIRG